MFGIGETELIIILLFGFMVFGPDKLPGIGRTIGRALRQFREAQQGFTQVVQTEVLDPAAEAMNATPTRRTRNRAAELEADSDIEDTDEGEAPRRKETFAERRARLEAERKAAQEAEEAAQAEALAAAQAETAETQSEGATSVATDDEDADIETTVDVEVASESAPVPAVASEPVAAKDNLASLYGTSSKTTKSARKQASEDKAKAAAERKAEAEAKAAAKAAEEAAAQTEATESAESANDTGKEDGASEA